jgi:F-type H+-transporting ATPase subunit epsilon
MRKTTSFGLTSDDEFEDVIPARTSHISERVYQAQGSGSVASRCQRGTHRGSLSDTTRNSSFHPTNNVGCHLATILHVSCLSQVFTAGIDCRIKFRYNKYTQIAARAVRQSLKENERVAAEKRGLTALRYQHWEGGKGGEQVAFFLPPVTPGVFG